MQNTEDTSHQLPRQLVLVHAVNQLAKKISEQDDPEHLDIIASRPATKCKVTITAGHCRLRSLKNSSGRDRPGIARNLATSSSPLSVT
jgi:hypothetical protein